MKKPKMPKMPMMEEDSIDVMIAAPPMMPPKRKGKPATKAKGKSKK